MNVRLGNRDRQILGSKAGQFVRAALVFLALVGGYLWSQGFFSGTIDSRSDAERMAAFKQDPLVTFSRAKFIDKWSQSDRGGQVWIGAGWFGLSSEEQRSVCFIILSHFAGTPLLTNANSLTLKDRNGHVGVYRQSTGLVMDP